MPSPASRWPRGRAAARCAGRRRTRRPPSRPSSRPRPHTSRDPSARALRSPASRARVGPRLHHPRPACGCRKLRRARCRRARLSVSWATIGVARCWMLAMLMTSGLAGALDPDRMRLAACGRSGARRSPARDGPSRCAAAARRGGRRQPGSALRRVEPASATVAAPAPLRRTRSSGLAPMNAASGVPTAEAEAGREQLAQGAVEGRRVVRRRRLDRPPRARGRPFRAHRLGCAPPRSRPPARSRAAAARC